MKVFSRAVFVLAAGIMAAEAANPLGMVIELLTGLAAKITKEGEVEAKAYAEFAAWCEDASTNKGFEIKTATTRLEELQAAIGKAVGQADASTSKIEDLAASISTDEADLKSAIALREKESANFLVEEKELMDVVDTLDRAIGVLSREMAKNPGAFAQIDTSNLNTLLKSLRSVVDAAGFSSAGAQKLLALVQARQAESADDEEPGAPDAAAYKGHSSGIIDVLEDLKEKAEQQLGDLRTAETSSNQKFIMLKQSLEDQISADSQDLAEEKAGRASTLEVKATAEGELAETKKDLTDAKSALEVVNGDCTQKAADHEATEKAREEELKVIAEAKKTLEETTAGAVEQTYSMLQLDTINADTHLQSLAYSAGGQKVVKLVQKLAREHNSPTLSQLAARISAFMQYGVSAGEDPFAKIKGMISELISKLEEEAGAEATEKAYCDKEIVETKEKKGSLEYELSKLGAKIDKATSKEASLKEDVQELEAELAQLTKTQAQMDKIRQETHADYVKAKDELEAGLEGVRKAVAILREYYGGAAAMLQGKAKLSTLMELPAATEKFSKSSGAGSSIISILELVESDFSKNLAAEETEEDSAEKDYEVMTQKNKVTKSLKGKDLEYKTAAIKELAKTLAELTSDRENTDDELSAVLDYYSKLKGRCIAKPESYEERAARRDAEIQGLKEALAILEDEVALVQRRKRSLRGDYVGL